MKKKKVVNGENFKTDGVAKRLRRPAEGQSFFRFMEDTIIPVATAWQNTDIGNLHIGNEQLPALLGKQDTGL